MTVTLWSILGKIDSGELRCISGCQCAWDDVFAGNVRFEFEGGVAVVVFNDAGSWDYVDSVEYRGEKMPFPVEREWLHWEPTSWAVFRMLDPGLDDPLIAGDARCPCMAEKP